jgi:peptide/nickel transport system permease protein
VPPRIRRQASRGPGSGTGVQPGRGVNQQQARMKILIRKVALFIPVALGISTLVFFLIHLIPGDPVEIMLGEGAQEANIAELRHQMGLDRPIGIQYADFLRGLIRGDLGRSIKTREPVGAMIRSRFPATFQLTLFSMLIAVLVAVPLGVLAAVRQYSTLDYSSMLLALLGISMPNFWLGPLLIIFFSVKLGWFPVSGMGGLSHMILPAVTLGTAMAALLARMTRSSMLEEIRSEYVKTARARGLSEAQVIFKHTLKNAMIPVITVIGLQFGSLLTGAIITETIFSWPGIGRLLITSINTRDYPVVQGCILFIAFSYLIVNFAVDIIYSYLDPRIRYD